MTATRLRPGAALDQTSPAALMTFMRKGMASPRNDALDVHYRYPYLHVVTSKRQPGISEGSIAKSLIIESHPQQATQLSSCFERLFISVWPMAIQRHNRALAQSGSPPDCLRSANPNP